jgi:hypothetical protein
MKKKGFKVIYSIESLIIERRSYLIHLLTVLNVTYFNVMRLRMKREKKKVEMNKILDFEKIIFSSYVSRLFFHKTCISTLSFQIHVG